MIGKLCVVLLIALFVENSVATSNFLCYWGSWSHYRNGNGKFSVDNIDYTKCTHLIYTFMGIQESGTIYSLDDWLDNGLGMLNKFNGLKSKRSGLKTLAAIGGWSSSTPFPGVAASASARAELIKSSIEFIQKYNFDGLDIDWEYPVRRGGTEADYHNFVTLLREFKAAFKPLGLLLTIAVSATPSTVAISYDVPAISKYVDFINVMTYDLHGSWESVTGHNSPLYPSHLDTTEAELELNVDACITNWIAQGAPAKKIILGMPLYGRTFTLASTSDIYLGAPIIGAGTAGQYTQEAGLLGYNEIVELINVGGWTYVWDKHQKIPYIHKNNQWIGFDDPRSLAEKVKYAQSKHLGGVMVWSIETDDIHGISGTKYPLLTAISKQLARSSDSDKDETNDMDITSEVSTVSVSTTTAPITDAASKNYICTKAGYIRDPADCKKFCLCVESNGNYVANDFICSEGLYFDLKTSTCDWPSAVTDCS